MKTRPYLFMLVAALAVTYTAIQVDAGTVVIPAWSFARGNAKIQTDPAHHADAGPVVCSGPEEPWGWTVEYEIDIPVTAYYSLQICYASAEPRPIDVRLDTAGLGTACSYVTFSPESATSPAAPSSNSSCAKWAPVGRWGNPTKIFGRKPLTKGKHTLKLSRRQALPNLIALRFDTETPFPKDWKQPQFAVRDRDSIPSAQRSAFQSPKDFLRSLPPALKFTKNKAGGTLTIPACTFDRGNARIYASPDKYAISKPMAGDGAQPGEDGVVEYDIDFPFDADYTLHITYAAIDLRPTDVYMDGKKLGKSCTGLSLNTAGFIGPHECMVNSRSTKTEGLYEKGKLLKVPVSKGKHTLKLVRRGPLPHLVSLRFDTETQFPKEWVQAERQVDLSRISAPHQAAFLPPESVNVPALRQSIEETIKKYGRKYSKGPQYLKRLSTLAAKQKTAEDGTVEQKQKVSDELVALRSEIMQAHPLLNFDKLLFIKRSYSGYGHTYSDQDSSRIMGGSLCVLSPVSPDGTVTPLVPELGENGLFDRFDLSYDAKKVVFSYKRSNETFRLYEIDIDPEAGKMVPASLRQLTFGGKEEAESLRCQVPGNPRHFNDMDPCYLPNGKIIFASTRAQRLVFCSPGAAVTTLHIMDADGKNIRRLSESPVSETAPSMLPDGRVIYARWEYVDKGLSQAQSLWSMHPDGSSVDHVYKNNTSWPAGMSSARAIPDSGQIVTIGGNHHFDAIGPVIMVDPRISRSSPDAMTCITPETGYPDRYGYPLDKNKFGTYMDPYPLSKDFFIVSHVLGVPPGQQRNPYALYMLDAWGNRAEIIKDPNISCFLPLPLRPRPKPMKIATVRPKSIPDGTKKTASLFVQDVYQGMTGIERGRVKYIRVMGALEWPWSETGISWRLGVYDPHRKKIYGIAKVHDDGSAHFKVPADENILFQALDEDFMALQEMASFINMMSGEQRACIGCHEDRGKAPKLASTLPTAMDHPVQDLMPQPGDTGPRMVDFTADIQPMLDKHCVSCHDGRKPDNRLNLVNVPNAKTSRSYDDLVGSGFICYRGGGKAGVEAVPPLTHGSRASKLPVMLMKGHHKVKLSRFEMIKLVSWIDANVPYNGTYRGNRRIEDKDHPNYRALPIALR